MISFGAPWVLIAGAALAGAVVLLHLLAPRPPARAPLPTARFLREDARTFVRLRQAPSDLSVLVLRVALALLLGALFAQPRWIPQRAEGTSRVVLLDRGDGMVDVWEAALARALAEEATIIVPFDTAVGEAIVGGSRESGTSRVAVDGPIRAESSYLVALRGLRRAALRGTTTAQVEAVLVTRPRWGAWDPQLAALRGSAWPGPIRVIDPGAPETSRPETRAAAMDTPAATAAPGATAIPDAIAPPPTAADTRAAAAIVPDERARRAAVAALTVLGYDVGDGDASGTDATLRFVASGDPGLAEALGRAERGDTVVVFGAAVDQRSPSAPTALAGLWDLDGWPDPARPPRILRIGETALQLAAGLERASGAASSEMGRRLPIAWEDGAPAAAALGVGSGCVVRFGGPLDAGAHDPGYPSLLRALADGCRAAPTSAPAAAHAPTPLDSAAAALLSGEGEAAVAVASLAETAGRRLESWVLVAVVLVTLAETALVERLRARRHRAGSGDRSDPDARVRS